VKRRDLLAAGIAAAAVRTTPGWARARRAGGLLVPMDHTQSDHLKAYGVTFRVLQRGQQAEWLLNYRGGGFLLPSDPATVRDALLAGVRTETVDAGAEAELRGTIAAQNMDAVPLEKAPRVAVYAPPNAAPWDDAVTMVMQYAGIAFDRVYDLEVLSDGLAGYDWLHLHHEDFTGQYSKFFLNYSGAPWLVEMVDRNQRLARQLGFAHVPALKQAVADRLLRFVEQGGFLFAMCTATETLDLALASVETDIAANYADGSPMDRDAGSRMRWDRALAFQGARLEMSPAVPVFSDIDGHQVNALDRRQQLGSFTLFNFSAKIDPVPTMLVQNHRQVIPDFYGLTTSFHRQTLKPGVTILADEPGSPWAKYIRGDRGQGTWAFYGGHDPEDPQHAIGDAPTDLSTHPHSPGYRLILNNVLFPAAKKKELKT